MFKTITSDAEKVYIIQGAQDDFRVDGRRRCDYRRICVETGIVSNTSGSAHVRLAKTDVLVGVKAEISDVDPDKPDQGKIEFFVDCAANASPYFERQGGIEISDQIRNLLYLFYHDALNLTQLCIIPGQQCWLLYVDVVVLECGGNLLDAICVGVKAALYDCKIPLVSIVQVENQREMEVSDNPGDGVRLDVTDVPCVVTLLEVGDRHIVDATPEEESCCKTKLAVATHHTGRLCGMRKMGNGSLDPETIYEMLETAETLGVTLNNSLMKMLHKEECDPPEINKCAFLY